MSAFSAARSTSNSTCCNCSRQLGVIRVVDAQASLVRSALNNGHSKRGKLRGSVALRLHCLRESRTYAIDEMFAG